MPWHDSLSKHLRNDEYPERFEVLWSDLVNRMAMGADAVPLTGLEEEEELRRQIEEELQFRMKQNGQAPLAQATDNLQAAAMARGFIVDDFVRYMIWEPRRKEILARFRDIVLPLLEQGRTIHIISHCWGTVVSYEGLRELDGRDFPGKVANLFVVGSAMSISAVERNLLRRTEDGRIPDIVNKWINLDADGDVVGGSLKPTFRVTAEYLQLKPTGCKGRRIFRKTAINPVCAHSSYFHMDNRKVNKQILAYHIRK